MNPDRIPSIGTARFVCRNTLGPSVTASTYADYYADYLAMLEQATYDACGPNVGPEEFDEAAERACKARNGMKRLNCGTFHRERRDRIMRTAASVFGSYITL